MKKGWAPATSSRKRRIVVLMESKQDDLKALRRTIGEAYDLLITTLPEQRSQRACELLAAAIFFADSLLEESPAAVFGHSIGF